MSARVLVRHAGHSYGSQIALHPATLELVEGVTVLIGANGAGKTTLLKTIVGSLPIADTEIETSAGQHIFSMKNRKLFMKHLGWLPQEFGYPPGMKTKDLVSYAAWLKQVPNDSIQSCVTSALKKVNAWDFKDKKVGRLSGGMRRRVGLACTLVHDPTLIVLDEPTAGLDPVERLRFYETLLEAKTKSRIVLVSTHLTEDIEQLADHILMLNTGRIVFNGTCRDLSGDNNLRNSLLELMR